MSTDIPGRIVTGNFNKCCLRCMNYQLDTPPEVPMRDYKVGQCLKYEDTVFFDWLCESYDPRFVAIKQPLLKSIKVKCPVCDKKMTLTSKGKVRAHQAEVWSNHLGRMVLRRCLGSGKKAE